MSFVPRKLTAEAVETIKRLRAEGVPVVEVAEKIGVTSQTVYAFLRKVKA